MKVFVYWNLHRGLWSVKALEGAQKGRVIARLGHLGLEDCEFKVSEAGRQRVLREGRKNVHAGIVGTLEMDADGWPVQEHTWPMRGTERFTPGAPVAYNPRTGPDFYLRCAGPLLGAVRKARLVNLFPDRSVRAVAPEA